MTKKKSDKPILTELGPKKWRAIVDKRYVGYGKTAVGAMNSAKFFRNDLESDKRWLTHTQDLLDKEGQLTRRLQSEIEKLKSAHQFLLGELQHAKTAHIDAERACDKFRDRVKVLRAQVDEMQPFFRDDKWVADRINHYNQACIDWIWRNKELPEYITYRRLMGLVT